MTQTHIDSATIQAITQLIVERFDPEQIILLGSYARGKVGAHSDVDLLVVLRTDGRPQHGQSDSSGDCRAFRPARWLMWLSALQKSSPSSAMIHVP